MHICLMFKGLLLKKQWDFVTFPLFEHFHISRGIETLSFYKLSMLQCMNLIFCLLMVILLRLLGTIIIIIT